MATTIPGARYSTVASFELLAGGRSYSVGHVAPKFLILENPQEAPLGEATLIIRVDDETIVRKIEIVGPPDPVSGQLPIHRFD